MQYFKGDETELKFDACASPIIALVGSELDDMFDGAYSCALLGDLISEDSRAPLANAIPIEIFRTTFNDLFLSFEFAGTFEAYLDVFRKIFGSDVDVQFTVPSAGKLLIDIDSENSEISPFVARLIVENAFEYDPMVTLTDADTIVFRTVQGFESEYELTRMLFEMVPAGIYTEITLTLTVGA